MSIEYTIQVLKQIPSASSMSEHTLNRKQELAEKEFQCSFSRERILDKILEKANRGEHGYKFYSSNLIKPVGKELFVMVKQRYEDLFKALGYDVEICLTDYNGYYNIVTMNIVWIKNK